MSAKLKMVCAECGSEDVLRDAWAEWCVETQEWVLQNVFDDAYCEKCEGECSIEGVVLTEDEVEDLAEDAQVRAIHNG